MNKSHRLTISIKRFLPETEAGPRWQRFDLESEAGMTVLDCLNRIRETIDATLSWRSSCRMGVCGSCAMLINGLPGLACSTQINNLGDGHVKLEPLWNFSVIKDLVTNLSPMFDQHRRLKAYLIRPGDETPESGQRELLQAPHELLDYLQFSYCIKCGACVAACPTVALDQEFPGPMPLAAAHRYNVDTRDDGFNERRQALAGPQGVSHCHYAGECSRVCPKGVDPARAIQLLKKDLIVDLFRSGRRPPAQLVAPRHASEKTTDDSLRPPEFNV